MIKSPRCLTSVVLTCGLLFTSNAVFADGGISGGGGGSIPDNPAGKYLIEEILKDANGELLMIFQGAQESEGNLFGDELYNGEQTIYDVIRSSKIGIRRDGPCIGLDGKEYDGSVVGPTSDSICISVKSLGEKLSKDNAHRQTLALVAHEYGHLLGLDEEAATKLQKFMIYYFEDYVQRRERGFFFDVIDGWRDRLSSVRAYISTSSMVFLSPSTTENDKWIQACRMSRTLETNFTDRLHFLDRKFASYLPVPKQQYQQDTNEMHSKFLGYRAASCGLQDEHYREQFDTEIFNLYVSAFSGHDQVNVAEFSAGFYGTEIPATLGERMITRIKSIKTVMHELEDMLGYINSLEKALDEFGVPTTLIEF